MTAGAAHGRSRWRRPVRWVMYGLVALTVAAATLALYDATGLAAFRRQQRGLEEEIERLTIQLQEIAAADAARAEFETALTDLEGQVAKLAEILPETLDGETAIAKLRRNVAELGLELDGVELGEEQDRDFYREQRLAFTLHAPPERVDALLAALGRGRPVCRLRTLQADFRRDAAAPVFSIEVGLAAYIPVRGDAEAAPDRAAGTDSPAAARHDSGRPVGRGGHGLRERRSAAGSG